MHVQKLRTQGLIPAGAYFADIAAKLEELNAREAARCADLEEEDRALETLYRKRSAVRAAHATMN